MRKRSVSNVETVSPISTPTRCDPSSTSCALEYGPYLCDSCWVLADWRQWFRVVLRSIRGTRRATKASLQSILGAASNPRENPRPNPVGTPRRTLDEALRIARDHGVEIDDDEFTFTLSPFPLGPGVGAQYLSFDAPSAHFMVECRRLLNNDGKVHVTVCPTILVSDEEIVHVLAHEVYESRALLAEFDRNRGSLRADVVASLVRPPLGTLHCDAWDYADDMLRRFRGPQNG